MNKRPIISVPLVLLFISVGLSIGKSRHDEWKENKERGIEQSYNTFHSGLCQAQRTMFVAAFNAVKDRQEKIDADKVESIKSKRAHNSISYS